MNKRTINFSAGPALLPSEVLEEACEAIQCYGESGVGIMEMSHRTPDYEAIRDGAERDLRELLEIPDTHEVIFITGGATNQFSMVPMNLLQPGSEGNYLITGFWGEKAAKEAESFGAVHVVANSKDRNYAYIPEGYTLSENPAYLHFTSNNTIVGTQFRTEPFSGGAPLICDASSDILSRRIDLSKYGVLYAAAQKNLGPAGVTVVIIQKDLLARSPKNLPVLMNYNVHVENRSFYNTPPTFPIYVVGLVLKWMKRRGGLVAMEQHNEQKAALLYDAIDRNDFFVSHADREVRSLMNVVWRLRKPELEPLFLEESKRAGFVGLKGHKLLGGFRASIYNACPLDAIERLVGFLEEFSKKHR